MPRQLIVIAGKDSGKTFPVPETGTFTIGRGSATDTKLTDARVSRTHCMLEAESDRVLLRDNKSTVGTFVNNQQVSEFVLHSGDVIRIGDTEMRFEGDDIAEAATVAGVMMPAEAATLAGEVILPPHRQPGGIAVAAVQAEPFAELLGTTIGHYTPTKLVAQGQTSIVFRAQDTNDARTVALKVLKPEAAKSDGEMQRLSRVLKPLATVQHPNLVAVYDVGKDRAHCWFALEFVEGETLAQVLQRVGLAGMLDWQHALRIALYTAQGLQHLHEHKFAHRAITPRCILISSGDKHPKLSGLTNARPLGEEDRTVAKPEDIFRNVAYLAPERARGETKVDLRSDIYGLGATLYALLTGRAPFDAASPVEVIAKVLQSEPPPPRDFQFAIPEAFEQVVLRCLAKKPEDRYAKVRDLLDDLDRVKKLQGVPTEALKTPANVRAATEGTLTVVHDCGQSLSVRKKFAGTQVRCPRCKQFLLVPGGNVVHSPSTKPLPRIPTEVIRRKQDEVQAESSGPTAAGASRKKVLIGVVVIVLAGVILFVLATLMNPGGGGGPSTENRPAPGGVKDVKPK